MRTSTISRTLYLISKGYHFKINNYSVKGSLQTLVF